MTWATRIHLHRIRTNWLMVGTALFVIVFAASLAAAAVAAPVPDLSEGIRRSTHAASANSHRLLLQDQPEPSGPSSSSSDSSDSSSASSGAVPLPTTGGSTIIVYTQPQEGTTSDGSGAVQNPSNVPIRVLICPGTPGCPDNNNNTSPTSSTSSPDQGVFAGTSGVQDRKPVEAAAPRPEEMPGQDFGFERPIDLSNLKRPDMIMATMLLKDVMEQEFVDKYGSQLDAITANITGTPKFVWSITVFRQQQQQRDSNRRLFQQQEQSLLNVTLSLFTTSPLIVWFRLTLDSSATDQPFNPKSVSFNCNTDYCKQLTAAGLPIASDISVAPDYPVLLTTPAAAAPASSAPNSTAKPPTPTTVADAATSMLLQDVANSKGSVTLIIRVVAGVASAVVGLIIIALIVWKRDSLKKCLGIKPKPRHKPKGHRSASTKPGSRKRKHHPHEVPTVIDRLGAATAAMVVSGAADPAADHHAHKDPDQSQLTAAEISKTSGRSRSDHTRSQKGHRTSPPKTSTTDAPAAAAAIIASMVSASAEPTSPTSNCNINRADVTSNSDPGSPTVDPGGSTTTAGSSTTQQDADSSTTAAGSTTGLQTHHHVERAKAAAADIPIPNLMPWPKYSSSEKNKYKEAAAAAAMSPISGSQPSSPRSVASASTTGSTGDGSTAAGGRAVRPVKATRATAIPFVGVNGSVDEFVSDSGTVITIQSSINAGVPAATSAALAAAVLQNK